MKFLGSLILAFSLIAGSAQAVTLTEPAVDVFGNPLGTTTPTRDNSLKECRTFKDAVAFKTFPATKPQGGGNIDIGFNPASCFQGVTVRFTAVCLNDVDKNGTLDAGTTSDPFDVACTGTMGAPGKPVLKLVP